MGSVDILINGAGGNHPRGNTTNDYYSKADVEAEDIISFYDLDPNNIQFVFNLNFVGTLLPTQVFSSDMVDKEEVSTFLKDKPQELEVVLTGRQPAPELAALADYLSDIRKIKHPYDQGIAAREGIEK